jgi:hypothetical protein
LAAIVSVSVALVDVVAVPDFRVLLVVEFDVVDLELLLAEDGGEDGLEDGGIDMCIVSRWNGR